LAQVYASADLFMFASTTDTFGQVILEAQASGLPVLAVDAGGPAELIEDGRSGCLVAPEPELLASALRGLARREAIRERLATGGLLAVGERSWERSLDQLADGYARALAVGTGAEAGTTAAESAEIRRAGAIARAA
jgi:glycosyltransferase involved in cell wall biosynthesis